MLSCFVYFVLYLDVENAYNWGWFINLLFQDFPSISIVMADKASGLMDLWVTTTARFSRCVKHMIANMVKAIKGGGGTAIQNLIYALVKAPSESHYTYLLQRLRLPLF